MIFPLVSLPVTDGDIEMKLAYLKRQFDNVQSNDVEPDHKIKVVKDFIKEAMEEYNQDFYEDNCKFYEAA